MLVVTALAMLEGTASNSTAFVSEAALVMAMLLTALLPAINLTVWYERSKEALVYRMLHVAAESTLFYHVTVPHSLSTISAACCLTFAPKSHCNSCSSSSFCAEVNITKYMHKSKCQTKASFTLHWSSASSAACMGNHGMLPTQRVAL